MAKVRKLILAFLTNGRYMADFLQLSIIKKALGVVVVAFFCIFARFLLLLR